MPVNSQIIVEWYKFTEFHYQEGVLSEIEPTFGVQTLEEILKD